MTRRNWKRWQPATLRDALKGCKDYALERHHLSVERIAERMGLEDHWALYKWIANGRMPLVLVPAYEHACGIALVARWMAATLRKNVTREVDQKELVGLLAELDTKAQSAGAGEP